MNRAVVGQASRLPPGRLARDECRDETRAAGGTPAPLPRGSWRAAFRFFACIGTLNWSRMADTASRREAMTVAVGFNPRFGAQ